MQWKVKKKKKKMNSQNSPLQKKLYYRQIIELFA